MAFVYKHEEIVRKIIQQRKRRLARLPAVKIAGIVLYALAIAYFAHHFNVVFRALRYPLRLQQFILRVELGHALLHVRLNVAYAGLQLVPPGNVMRGGKNSRVAPVRYRLAGKGVYFAYALYLVAKKAYTQRLLAPVRRHNVHRVPFYAEVAAIKIKLAALVLYVNKAL